MTAQSKGLDNFGPWPRCTCSATPHETNLVSHLVTVRRLVNTMVLVLLILLTSLSCVSTFRQSAAQLCLCLWTEHSWKNIEKCIVPGNSCSQKYQFIALKRGISQWFWSLGNFWPWTRCTHLGTPH